MAEEHYSFPTNNPVLLISDPTQGSNFEEESISPKTFPSASTSYHRKHNKKYSNTTESPTSHRMSHHYHRRGDSQSSSDSDSANSTSNASPISTNDTQRWLKYQTDLSPVKTPKSADPAQMPSPIEEAVDSDALSGDNGEPDVPKIATPYMAPKGSVPFIASIVYFKKRRTISSGIPTIPENEVFCNGADAGSDNSKNDDQEFSDKDVITKTELDTLRCKFGNIKLHHHHHGRHKLDPRRTKSLSHLTPLGEATQEIKKDNLHLKTAAKTVKEALSCYRFGSPSNGNKNQREKPQISPSVSPLTEEPTITAITSHGSENSNDEISSETDESLFDRVLTSDNNYGINNTDDDAFSQLEHRIDHQRRMSSSWFDKELKTNKSHVGGSNSPPFDSDHGALQIGQHDSHNHHDHHQHDNHHHKHHHHHYKTTPDDEEASRQLSPSSTITEHATSGAGTDDEGTSGTVSKSTQKRGKHQRHLTCAMVFTKPKVVEI